MRKIGFKTDSEKKRRRNNLILGIGLIVIMSLSVLGYGLGSLGSGNSQKKVSYNGYDFYEYQGFWLLQMDKATFVFSYNPTQVDKIDSAVKKFNGYSGKPLYVSSELDEASLELSQNMQLIVQRIQSACLEGEVCEDENLPRKTCEDNFIVIRETEVSDIRQEENCVFIQGPRTEIVKVVDEFLFKVFNIEQ